jgi:MYXO-CTERM domain-containing protein
MRPLLALALLASILAAAPALAHGGPSPDPRHTRLLADWRDDCGGDGGAQTGACKGSHDLLTLDVREVRDTALGDAVAFRLFLDKGQPGMRRDTLTVNTPGGARALTFQTSDDRTFTSGGGFDRVDGPFPVEGEATRLYVDGLVRLAALGKAGDTISGFKVEAFVDGSVGDYMPGGCHNTVGDCIVTGPKEDYARQSYTLRGPGYYARLTAPARSDIPAGTEAFVALEVKNLLAMPQQVTLTAQAPSGLTVRFHAPASGYAERLQVDLGSQGSTTVHLALAGEAGTEGDVLLALATDQGGYQEAGMQVVVGAPGPATSSPTGPTSRASPAPLWAGLAVLALLAGRRRT